MATPAYYSMVHSGSSGPDTALVQTWLNGLRNDCSWYGELKVDGRFGKSSENAVKEFQLRSGLASDGKVGRATWEALSVKYAAKYGEGVPYPGVVLRSGDSGAAVRYVQQKLAALGYAISADGKFGAKTANAVRGWQRQNGLAVDGAVGKESWAKMF